MIGYWHLFLYRLHCCVWHRLARDREDQRFAGCQRQSGSDAVFTSALSDRLRYQRRASLGNRALQATDGQAQYGPDLGVFCFTVNVSTGAVKSARATDVKPMKWTFEGEPVAGEMGDGLIPENTTQDGHDSKTRLPRRRA